MKKFFLIYFISAGFSCFSQDISSDTLTAKNYLLKGDGFYEMAQYDSSNIFYQKAANIYKHIAKSSNEKIYWAKHVYCLYSKAWNTLQIDYNEALLILNFSLKTALTYLGEMHPQTANIYNGLGVIYDDLGNFQLALKYHHKSLKIRKEFSEANQLTVAKSYNNIGIIYLNIGSYDLALRYHQNALAIKKAALGDKNPLVADSYNNMGIVYEKRGSYELALEYFQKALNIKKEYLHSSHPDLAALYNNIGSIYDNLELYEKSLANYQNALSIQLEIFSPKHRDVATSYNNIGKVFFNLDLLEKAKGYYQQALLIQTNNSNQQQKEVAITYNNLGIIYEYDEDNSQAINFYKKALTIQLKTFGKKHPDVASSYNNIGSIYGNSGSLKTALTYYQKALAANIFNFNNDTNIYVNPKLNDYLDQNELLITLQIKAKVLEKLYHKTKNIRDLQFSFKTFLLADELTNNIRKSHIFKSDKIEFGKTITKVYEGAIRVCLSLHQITKKKDYLYQAFAFSEKNKATVLLGSLIETEAQNFAGIPDSTIQKEKALKVELSFYKKKIAEQQDSITETEYQEKLFNLDRKYDTLISFLENHYPEYHKLKYSNGYIPVNKIQNQLDKRSGLISYFTGDSVLYVFTITKNKYLIESHVLDSTFYHYQNDILNNISQPLKEKRNNGVYINAAHELYKILIPNKLPEKINSLVIIPDATLSKLPFEALLTEKYSGFSKDFTNMSYLMKKYSISYSYSVNLYYHNFTKPQTNHPTEGFLAFAPVFPKKEKKGEVLQSVSRVIKANNASRIFEGKSILAIKASENEVKDIHYLFEKHQYSSKVYTYMQAKEDSLKLENLKNYKYLHIASHGLVNEKNPELSFVLFAQDSTAIEDGFLFSGEIYNLELNSDLVTLSACVTGIGKLSKGEGIIGLGRGLLYAGARNFIVSLWNVNDFSTARLMKGFYKNLLEASTNNMNYSLALQKIKLKMINDPMFAHPYYWAPFVLIGK